MATNGVNNVEDAEMADSDGEKVVTMMDVLQEQQDFEDDANAVLGASDDKECTYSKGYIKRQAIYACLTCCAEAKYDPLKRAGVCLACSLNCHENHELIELYTKRNFRCDCGNPKFNSHPCTFTPNKTDLNEDNIYNQNFCGLYCNCHRPYPDPETNDEDEMIQCIICEDWLHAAHLDAVVPSNELYSEMICKACMEKNEFLHDYSHLTVNVENGDVDILTVNGNDVKLNNGDLETEILTNGTEETPEGSKDMSIDPEILAEIEPDVEDNKIVSNEATDKVAQDLDKAVEENKTDSEQINALPTEAEEKSEESFLDGTSETKEEAKEVPNLEESTKEPETSIGENSENQEESDLEKSEHKTSETVEEPVTKHYPETSEHKTSKTVEELVTNAESLEESVTNTETLEESVTNAKSLEESMTDAESLEESVTNAESLEESVTNAESLEKSVTNAECLQESVTNAESMKESAQESVINAESVEESVVNAESADPIAQADETKDSTEEKSSADVPEMTNDVSEKDVSEKASENPEVTNTSEVTSQDKNQVSESEPEKIEETEKSESKEPSLDAKPEVSEPSTENEHNEETPASKIDTDDIEMNDNEESITENADTSKEDKPDNVEMGEPSNETAGEEISISKVESTADTNEPLNKENDEVEVPNTVHSTEHKRKLSTEATDDSLVKKPKLDEANKCSRPKGVKKVHKGATFWPSSFRQKLCTCNECLTMYKDLSVLFLIDLEDTVTAYETLGQEKTNGGPTTQYEKGLEALSSLDRIQQINALTEYNKMRDKLLDFLKSFKDRKEIVKEEDIKAFFAGMKPKRESDGVYFCR